MVQPTENKLASRVLSYIGFSSENNNVPIQVQEMNHHHISDACINFPTMRRINYVMEIKHLYQNFKVVYQRE